MDTLLGRGPAKALVSTKWLSKASNPPALKTRSNDQEVVLWARDGAGGDVNSGACAAGGTRKRRAIASARHPTAAIAIRVIQWGFRPGSKAITMSCFMSLRSLAPT